MEKDVVLISAEMMDEFKLTNFISSKFTLLML